MTQGTDEYPYRVLSESSQHVVSLNTRAAINPTALAVANRSVYKEHLVRRGQTKSTLVSLTQTSSGEAKKDNPS